MWGSLDPKAGWETWEAQVQWVQRGPREGQVCPATQGSRAKMVRRERRGCLEKPASEYRDPLERKVTQASRDSQVTPGPRGRRVAWDSQACQGQVGLKERRDSSATQVNQEELGKRGASGCLGHMESLVSQVAQVNLVCKVPQVQPVRKERLALTVFLDPQEKEETQVCLGGASLELLDSQGTKVTRAVLVYRAIKAFQVSQVSRARRGLQATKEHLASRERGVSLEPP